MNRGCLQGSPVWLVASSSGLRPQDWVCVLEGHFAWIWSLTGITVLTWRAPLQVPRKPGASVGVFASQVCWPASLPLPHRMAVDVVLSRCAPRRCLGHLRRLLSPTEPQPPHLLPAGLPPLPYLSPLSGCFLPGLPTSARHPASAAPSWPALLMCCLVSAPTPASELPGGHCASARNTAGGPERWLNE